MKKKKTMIIIILSICLILSVRLTTSAEEKQTYTISVTIPKINQETKVYQEKTIKSKQASEDSVPEKILTTTIFQEP